MAIQIKGAAPKAETPNKITPALAPTPAILATKVAGKPSELAAAIKKIRGELGEKSIVKGSEVPQCRRLPTGVFEFDLATGGGFPRGRYTILYGPESSCKTNLVYKAIATAQRLPPPCNKAVLVDLEGTFDPTFAVQFGVDVDELIVVKPSYGEQAVDMIDALIRADDVAFIGVDSIATIVAAKEVDGSVEKMDVGTAAMLIKRLSNKLAIALSEEQKRDHDPCVVLINQTRFKIGVMFGNPETMPGGQTVKFLASLIVRVSGKNLIVKEISANIPAFKSVTAVIKKAKVGVVQESFEFDMCMLAHDGLMVGETDSFNKIKNYLQASGDLVKADKGWSLFGKNYPTLVTLQDTYRAEDSLAQQMRDKVVQNHKMVVVADKPMDEKDETGSGVI